MANGIRTGDPRGFNKGRSSKFRKGSRVWQTPEEGWRTYRTKCSGNNNKDEDNSLKTLNDNNHQASSQKFRQIWYSSWNIRKTLNDEFENFVTTHIEAAAECIPTKPTAKCWVLWEAVIITEKWDNIRIVSLLNKRNPTNANAQRELTHTKKNNKNTFKIKSKSETK